jgi:tight adherence protein B
MAAEVMAISLASGQSLSHAQSWASEVAQKYSTHAEISSAELAQCDRYVQLASLTGVALSPLLRAQAQVERNTAREEAQMRVEKLSVQLMIPLGVCVLPAFIAVGVLPLVASVISSTTLNS